MGSCLKYADLLPAEQSEVIIFEPTLTMLRLSVNLIYPSDKIGKFKETRDKGSIYWEFSDGTKVALHEDVF